jgi:hypothetical protein
VLQLVRAASSHRRRLPQSFGHRRNSRSRARERWTMTAGTSTQTRRKPARWRSSTPARAGPKQRGKSASASRRCRSGFSGAEPSNIRAHFGPKRSRNQLWRKRRSAVTCGRNRAAKPRRTTSRDRPPRRLEPRGGASPLIRIAAFAAFGFTAWGRQRGSSLRASRCGRSLLSLLPPRNEPPRVHR